MKQMKTDPPKVDLSGSDLDQSQKDILFQTLCQNCDVFANTSEELGRSSIASLNIDTGDNRPVKQAPYRTGVIEKGIIDHHVDKLQLLKGLISPSNSPWSSLNPDNYRMAIDYRKLNAHMTTGPGPCPGSMTLFN
jgi:hypothetical protein